MAFTIRRTYPQPDSPEPQIGPRERALAVFKYLLELEPEAAVRHPLFDCIVNAFVQAEIFGWVRGEWGRVDEELLAGLVGPALVPMLTSERPVPDPFD